MNKNIIIIVLSLLLISACFALNHVTNRLDVAAAYIDALETDFPEYLDITAEGDAYDVWYKYLWE